MPLQKAPEETIFHPERCSCCLEFQQYIKGLSKAALATLERHFPGVLPEHGGACARFFHIDQALVFTAAEF